MPNPPEFGRRRPPQPVAPPPVVYHATQGLGGAPPHEPRRLRSMVIGIGAFGLLVVLWQAYRDRYCQDWDQDKSQDLFCQSSGHSGVHGGFGSGESSASFGDFGATGESGAHSGGHGGGHGGGE
jgi:hypothetical protein